MKYMISGELMMVTCPIENVACFAYFRTRMVK
jgi:hypothetical protein